AVGMAGEVVGSTSRRVDTARRLASCTRARTPRRRASARTPRTFCPWIRAGIPRFPWCRPLRCPSQGLGLELLRLEDLVGNLVGDVSEVLNELDVLVVREIGLAAAFRCKPGPDDLRLPDGFHALGLFRSN